MEDKDIFEIREIDDWGELKSALNDLGPDYIFRGQKEAKWNIKTTIERKSERNLSFAERAMLSEFEKNIYTYDLKRIPKSNLETLLFLQHFGAPTRLIDFSESFYVASFFALKGEHKRKSSIYAIHSASLDSRLMFFDDEYYLTLLDKHFKENDHPIPIFSDPKLFDKVILSSRQINFVTTIAPIFHHERSNPQSSIHITIGNIEQTFLHNLNYFLNHSNGELDSKRPFIKFIIPNELRREALCDLNQMNINYSSLFPDFGGYIKNLYLRYECNQYKEKVSFLKFNEQEATK